MHDSEQTIVFQDLDDYNTARRKTKKAEDTSDLNSSEVDTKRKRIKNRLYENETDDEQCNIARALTKQNKIIQSSSEESDESDTVLPKHSQMTDALKTAGQIAMQKDNNNCVNPEIENNSFLTNSMRCTCQLCPAHAQMQNKNEKYFKQIIRQQNYFKTQLWQTVEDIQDIKNTGLNPAPNNDVQKQESVFCFFTLPLETEQQLQEVEQYLTNQNNFKASVTQASRTGGKHSYEFMKRNLSQLLSNKLAEEYSWLGKKKKQKFHELKLANMLIGKR
ncbi:uncharacterized protein LOC112464232 isoform X2 [Temnothorax curvispinosus]|uniref:Uncharacterized protein LOC112464232 isoform X2 n=1 Tax=Temnothorax curvispinosus TaxID=300111 RepID=A0A6J1R252_9HYME|nr:uncharacterized protein LOC112464232 isoform X2 [Temnothorax curvispinosus]